MCAMLAAPQTVTIGSPVGLVHNLAAVLEIERYDIHTEDKLELSLAAPSSSTCSINVFPVVLLLGG